jgi:hypothetical protein
MAGLYDSLVKAYQFPGFDGNRAVEHEWELPRRVAAPQ